MEPTLKVLVILCACPSGDAGWLRSDFNLKIANGVLWIALRIKIEVMRFKKYRFAVVVSSMMMNTQTHSDDGHLHITLLERFL